MADQRTMAELLRVPTEVYAEAIVVPLILAEHFKLKHSLINMAWDRYKDLLRAFPHHGFTELHQLDTFYNALNPADQDSLNSAADGNLLKRCTQDVLMIIENKSKQTSAVTTAMTNILKQFQATPPLASVKAVEEICITCGGAHSYYQCLVVDGNTFLQFWDNIQGYISVVTVNYIRDMYDSWKSRMELYMLNRQHGRMILESVENGPLLWPTVKENGVTRLKKYSELSATEAIQADCDVKATNIVLQGLPPKVYTLVSTHKVAKELWERIQMLMQGTSLTKQE
nr:reverse transcriptase domain-containing protein [Tanacetum cinerariifolium]